MSLMKRVLLLIAVLAGPVLIGTARAQTAAKVPPAIIAVIDSQRINREAAALKNARQQLEQYRAGFQSEIAKEEEKLRNEEQEISRQRSVVTPEVFQQKRQAFQGKVVDLQKRIQERSQSLEKMLNSVRDQVTVQVVDILKELATERGFNFVLDRAQVQLFVGDSIDITPEVLKRLDKRLPTVKVALPSGK
ncbi:MAG TPA: OmpH family outer membrane protein [Ferrovibrio sp.]|uniref:OmpH family outer membrane protein n=1 Tax=Ferrovibrio sp. TaxID=1917215 RepID=UPI002ED32654